MEHQRFHQPEKRSRWRFTEKGRVFLASEFYRVSSLLPNVLRKPAEKCKIVVVATGAKVALRPLAKLGEKISDTRWQEIDFVKKSMDALSEIGFKDINIVDVEGKSKKELRKEIGNPDVLFVAGGNPFALTRDGFPKYLRNYLNRGGFYVGSSAGTVIVGDMTGQDHGHLEELSKLPTFKKKEFKRKRWKRGIKYIKATIIAHADDKEDEQYRQEVKEVCTRRRVSVIELTNEEALVGSVKRRRWMPVRHEIIFDKINSPLTLHV